MAPTKLVLFVVLAAALAGCASGPPLQQRQAAFISTVPTCSTERECELKWSAARQWILSNAGMKLQHVTPDFLETYNPPRDSTNLAVRVVKKPMVNGGYQIQVSTWCNNIFTRIPNQWDAAQHFNNTVNAAVPNAAPDRPQTPVSTDFSCPKGSYKTSAGCISNQVAPAWCSSPGDKWDGESCSGPRWPDLPGKSVPAAAEVPLGPQRPSECPTGSLWNHVQEECMTVEPAPAWCQGQWTGVRCIR